MPPDPRAVTSPSSCIYRHVGHVNVSRAVPAAPGETPMSTLRTRDVAEYIEGHRQLNLPECVSPHGWVEN